MRDLLRQSVQIPFEMLVEIPRIESHPAIFPIGADGDRMPIDGNGQYMTFVVIRMFTDQV